MWQDLRFGLRIFSRNRGFALVAVTALALGIGANATVFSIANPIFFKNLPFEGSEDLLYVSSKNPARNGVSGGVSRPDFDYFRSTLKSLPALGASDRGAVNLADSAAVPEFHQRARVTSNILQVLGQKPILGRGFTADDERPGAPPVAILTWRLWQHRYAGSAGVIGQTIRLDSVPTVVIGVLPRNLQFPLETELWTNLMPTGREARDARNLTVFGKLADGLTQQSARAELALASLRLETDYPAENKGITYEPKRFHDIALQGGVHNVVGLLLGAVGFVLLIACANVANLLLSRAAGRAREISIRTSLGAGRVRLVRQLLAESILLAGAGGLMGWLLSMAGVRAFDAAVADTGKPDWIDFSPDYHSIAWLLFITFATAILFGLAPAMRLSRVNLNATLKDGGRGTGGTLRGSYLTSAFVVVQMMLSVVLLTGAGLMMRSLLNAYARPLGVNPAGLLTVRLDLPESRYPDQERNADFRSRLATRLRALSGVQSVAIADTKQSAGFGERYQTEGAETTDPRRLPRGRFIVADYGYFETLGITARAGRLLSPADHVQGPAVAVLNQTLARQMWPTRNPVGRRFRMYPAAGPGEWTTVVGVVPDYLPNVSDADDQPAAIIPFRQFLDRALVVLIRARTDPAALTPAVRREIAALDPDLPAHDINTLEEEVDLNRWPFRVFGSMFAVFAGIALLLATVGLYAVVAYGVSLRTQEIGVRVALGASGTSVMRMVLAGGIRQAGLGLALGLVAAFAVTRVMEAILVSVSPFDPVTFVTVSIVLAVAILVGCLIPARRAAAVNPVVALRSD